MKNKSSHLILVLALFADVHSALAQVTNLGIAPAGNQTVLFWPTTATNSVLQSTTNLASPNWATVSNGIPLNAVGVSNTSPATFFRLYNTNPPAGMVLIPAGSFTMGNTIGDSDITDANPTNVMVSAFYMDTNLVSYGQWQMVYSWATNSGYGFVNAGLGKAVNNPVQTVDWYDCVKWCNARSQQAGLTPVYYTDAGLRQTYTNGEVTLYANWAANGYRLPTEAEWEKAARGGLIGQRFPLGNTISESQANYFGNPGNFSYDLGPNGYNAIGSIGGTSPATSPVGSFAPNGYRLYDMAGNVSEWCWDWYGTPYDQPTTNNPIGPATGTYRILRGGLWTDFADLTRCANRHDDFPSDAYNYLHGFRCVRWN
jgi:formylglycine-generating enzyme